MANGDISMLVQDAAGRWVQTPGTVTGGVRWGERFLEFDLLAVPAAPAEGKVRMFLRDNEGLELVARLPNGTIAPMSGTGTGGGDLSPDLAGGVIDLPTDHSFGSFNPALALAPLIDQISFTLLIPDGGMALGVSLYGTPTAILIGYVLTPGATDSANYKLGWRVRAPL